MENLENEIINIPQTVIVKLQSLDSITLNHSIRLQELARSYEKYAKIDNNLLSSSALVHDIGKLFISSKILDKPFVLTDLEREIINLHPYFSYRILKDDDVDDRVCSIALYHHGLNPPMLNQEEEKQNGDELINAAFADKILDYSEIIRVLDMYEALTSDRPYRRGFLPEESIDIIRQDATTSTKVIDFLCDVIVGHSY